MLITDVNLCAALEKSGWSPQRKVEVAHWVVQMEGAGFVMNTNARDVLASFGGLVVRPEFKGVRAYMPAVVRFDPALLRHDGRPLRLEQSLGITLSPVGECLHDSAFFIGDDNRLYAGWSGLWMRLGDDFEDSLKTLVLADKMGTRIGTK